MIRSCYEVDMNLYNDDQTRPTRVRWYFVPNDREALPYASPFRSRVWEEKEDPPVPLGEVYGTRKWRGGLPEKIVARNGHCGTERQWRFGCEDDDPIGPNYPNTQVPTCCNAPLAHAIAIVGVGNPGQQPVCCLPDEAPDVLHLTFTVTSGSPCPELDGLTILLQRLTNCTTFKLWESEIWIWGIPPNNLNRLWMYCDGTSFRGIYGLNAILPVCQTGAGVVFEFDQPKSCDPPWWEGNINLQCSVGFGSHIRLTVTR